MKLLSAFLHVLLFMALAVFIFSVGPLIEERFFPVYSKFTIVEAVNVPGGVRAVFRFTKWRNCDPSERGIAWYHGDEGSGFTQLRTENLGPPAVLPRPIGTQRTNPWLFQGIDELDLRSEVFAEVYARCHPLWITRTVVFP